MEKRILGDFANFEIKIFEFFLPFVFAQVLNNIRPQIKTKMTAASVQADAPLLQDVRRDNLRYLINFSELAKLTPRKKAVLKNCRERALSI
jgi:hypothetical protein